MLPNIWKDADFYHIKQENSQNPYQKHDEAVLEPFLAQPEDLLGTKEVFKAYVNSEIF